MPDTSPSTASAPGVTLDLFLRRLWAARVVVLAAGLLGAALGFIVAARTPPAFEATATVLVRQAGAASPTVATSSMKAVIANHAVARQVVSELQLPVTPGYFVKQSLRIEDVPGTYLMRVVVRLPDAAMAARAANLTVRQAMTLNSTLGGSGADRLQRVMQDELAVARRRMGEAEAAVREFKVRRRAGQSAAGLHEEEIEGARLHAEYDLATRLYEEIAVQFGKLRLQIAEQASELLIVEEAAPPESGAGPARAATTLFGGVTGLTLGLLLSALLAFLKGPSSP